MKPRSAENKASEMQRRLDAYVEEHNMRRSPTRTWYWQRHASCRSLLPQAN